MLWCDRVAPFGAPVVPLVNCKGGRITGSLASPGAPGQAAAAAHLDVDGVVELYDPAEVAHGLDVLVAACANEVGPLVNPGRLPPASGGDGVK